MANTDEALASAIEATDLHLTPPVVRFVHGTWASDAEWTDDESLLCQTLRKQFDTVIFKRFKWDGYNSASHRWNASLQLRTEIRGTIKDNPFSRHFIIGHSHGGNVGGYPLTMMR